MNKYVIFITLTTPFVLYLMFNVVLLYKLKKLRLRQTVLRLVLWGGLLAGIWFTRPITDFLYQQDLTASPPLSIFDVFLATGLLISFVIIARAHSRLRDLEDKLAKLHEKASIAFSDIQQKR